MRRPGIFGILSLTATLLAAWNCAGTRATAMTRIETLPASCHESSLGPGDYERKMQHGGRNRRYFVHVPPGYDKSRPVPVVLFFHGGGGTAQNNRNFPGWDPLADRKGFIVVYPDGAGPLPNALHSWNAGDCGGWAMKRNIDDVGFTAALLDELEKTFCIDRRRVYATGFSNGAMMSYRLGAQMSGRIAAIGPVSGTLCRDIQPRLTRPVSVIHFHGTADPYEPYQGGKGDKSFPLRPKNVFRSVDDTVKTWAGLIGASQTPVPTGRKPDATEYTFRGGRGGSEVVLWKLEGGGHTWPGGGRMPAQRMMGKVIQDVPATETIWWFFEKHPIAEGG